MKNAMIIQSFLLVLFCWTATQAQQTSSKEGKTFTFTNNTGQATNDLHLKLSKATRPTNLVVDPVTGVKKAGGMYENYPSQDVSPHDYKTGGAGVANGSSVVLQMNENTRINSWYWTFNGRRVGPEMNGNTADLTVVSAAPRSNPDGAWVSVGGVISQPFSRADDIHIGHTQLADNFTRSITSRPEIFERLVEQLGGIFVAGEQLNPSQHVFPDANLRASSTTIPGISLGLNLNRNLELSLGAHYFSSRWSGQFPVTVFPFQGTQPRIEQGFIHSSAKGILADVGLRYLLPGKVRPYIEAGGRGQFVLDNQSSMEVGGMDLPFEMPALKSGFSGYAGGGVRAYLGRSLYVQAGATFTRWPGSEYKIGGNVGLGLTIGNAGKGRAQEHLLLNDDDEEVDYDKITKRDELPKLIIPGYDRYTTERAINGKSHDEAMKKAFSSERAQKRWSEVFKRIYGK